MLFANLSLSLLHCNAFILSIVHPGYSYKICYYKKEGNTRRNASWYRI